MSNPNNRDSLLYLVNECFRRDLDPIHLLQKINHEPLYDHTATYLVHGPNSMAKDVNNLLNRLNIPHELYYSDDFSVVHKALEFQQFDFYLYHISTLFFNGEKDQLKILPEIVLENNYQMPKVLLSEVLDYLPTGANAQVIKKLREKFISELEQMVKAN